MSEVSRLTLAFLEHAPRAAAKVMQSLPTEEVASFIDDIPARYSATALNSMIPWQAARCLELVAPTRAASILRQLPFADAVGFARFVRADHLERIVEELPTSYGKRLEGSLRYPMHQAGAWIDPDVLRLRTRDTVQDALRVLRAAEPMSHIFLESEDRERYVGAISVRDVLRADATQTLDQLPIEDLTPLSSLSTMSSVSFDERWDRSLSLPVVGRRGNLLGGLSRHALRKGMRESHAVSRPESRTIAEHLASMLFVVCAEILNLTVPSEPGRKEPASGAANHDS